MKILKKITFFSVALMLCVIVFNMTAFSVSAIDNSDYEKLCDEIKVANQLDEAKISEYQDYVTVVDGKYEFDCDICNDDTKMILENIRIVNDFVDRNEGFLCDDGLVFYCEDELATQFGFTNVNWHWYGVDLTMDKEMIITVCTTSLIVNLLSASKLKDAIARGSSAFSSIGNQIASYTRATIGTNSKMIELFGSKLYSRLIDRYGSYDKLTAVFDTIVSTAVVSAFGVLTVASVASCGTAAIVWSIISYVIGLFTPGVISSTICLIGACTNVITTATMKIRWFCGWGTNLYY